MIWLVDYNHYSVNMDRHLSALRNDYFTIKRYARYMKIGRTAPVGTKVFSNGLLRLATILDYNGVDVKYLHFYMLEELLSAGEFPEIIAFSAVCPTVPRCAALAQKIKLLSPETKIILGGAHVNQETVETRKRYPVFDELCVGYELEAASFLAKKSLQNMPPLYVDYRLLPYPLKEYSINTFTTMGCPFHCDYCADGNAPYFKAMEDGQLSIMKELLPSHTLIHFFDSVLGYTRLGAFEVCKRLQNLDHRFILSCDMRADLLSPALIHEFKNAGFREIRLGLDTASEDILRNSHRSLMPKVFLDQLKMIRECSDLYISVYSITGLPGTTWDRHEQTLEFFHYLYQQKLVDEIKNAIYVPYPMQHVDFEKRGVFITDTDWAHYDRASYPVYRLTNLSANQIWKLFIKTAEHLNVWWLNSLGFESISEIPRINAEYHEYYESNYK